MRIQYLGEYRGTLRGYRGICYLTDGIGPEMDPFTKPHFWHVILLSLPGLTNGVRLQLLSEANGVP